MNGERENLLRNIVIVLYRPMFGRNIGAVARSIHTMGFGYLRLVAPPERFEQDAFPIAGEAEAVLREAEIRSTLADAISDCPLVAGTTARPGGWRQGLVRPQELAPSILGVARHANVALVFGKEDSGLDNEAISLCHRLMTIPTDPHGLKSINLAQSVLLLGHELWQTPCLAGAHQFQDRAPNAQQNAFIDRLMDLLLRVSYFTSGIPAYRILPFRRLFGRAIPSVAEIEAWSTFVEYAERGLQPQLLERKLPAHTDLILSTEDY